MCIHDNLIGKNYPTSQKKTAFESSQPNTRKQYNKRYQITRSQTTWYNQEKAYSTSEHHKGCHSAARFDPWLVEPSKDRELEESVAGQ